MIALFAVLLIATPASDELQRAYDQIALVRRTGKVADAAAAFEKLANSNPESELAQRALATAAEIHHWDLGDLEKARALYDRVLLGRDDRRGVLPALIGRLWIEKKELGVKAELELARKIESKQPRAEHAPWLLLHSAKLLADELGDLASAVGMLERLRAEHASSTYVDDALILEARLLRELKRPRDALILYGAIIESKKNSIIIGSYDSVHLDDAFFEVAETLRVDLRQEALAEKAYLELVEEMPRSVLVDDALHQARLLAAARGDMKQAAEYIARLRKLRPDSRFL